MNWAGCTNASPWRRVESGAVIGAADPLAALAAKAMIAASRNASLPMTSSPRCFFAEHIEFCTHPRQKVDISDALAWRGQDTRLVAGLACGSISRACVAGCGS